MAGASATCRRAAAVCVLSLLWQCVAVRAHGDHGSTGAACGRNVGVTLQAAFVPGSITIDGEASDWDSLTSQSFSLLPALSDDAKMPYPEGDHSMHIKVLGSLYSKELLFYYSRKCFLARKNCWYRMSHWADCSHDSFYFQFEMVPFNSCLALLPSFEASESDLGSCSHQKLD